MRRSGWPDTPNKKKPWAMGPPQYDTTQKMVSARRGSPGPWHKCICGGGGFFGNLRTDAYSYHLNKMLFSIWRWQLKETMVRIPISNRRMIRVSEWKRWIIKKMGPTCIDKDSSLSTSASEHVLSCTCTYLECWCWAQIILHRKMMHRGRLISLARFMEGFTCGPIWTFQTHEHVP